MNQLNTKKSLVLVVGAGASCEVNLPVGSQLRTQISQALDIKYPDGYNRSTGDHAIDEAYRILAKEEDPFLGDINPFLKTSWRIRDAMPQSISIDNFIDSHRSDDRIAICGKLAIARCILQAEANSHLFIDPRLPDTSINFSKVEGTWFNALFQLITENCQESEIDQRLAKIAIVCFNYDRCIEHYLHSSLQNYYGITSERAAQAISNLQIFHPYGAVGPLPWQSSTKGVNFGQHINGKKLIEISKDIKTFTEGINPELSEIVEIRRELENAERIAFLGFAFHRLNLRLLFPGLNDGKAVLNRPTYATAFGISNADCQEIRGELSSLGAIFNERCFIRNDLTCANLFREFWRSLSLQS
jgi:hypothetical protein